MLTGPDGGLITNSNQTMQQLQRLVITALGQGPQIGAIEHTPNSGTKSGYEFASASGTHPNASSAKDLQTVQSQAYVLHPQQQLAAPQQSRKQGKMAADASQHQQGGDPRIQQQRRQQAQPQQFAYARPQQSTSYPKSGNAAGSLSLSSGGFQTYGQGPPRYNVSQAFTPQTSNATSTRLQQVSSINSPTQVSSQQARPIPSNYRTKSTSSLANAVTPIVPVKRPAPVDHLVHLARSLCQPRRHAAAWAWARRGN